MRFKQNDVNELQLEIFRAAAERVLSSRNLQEMGAGFNFNYAVDILENLVIHFTRDIASWKVCDQEIRYPKDWWQAFKERWFPRWLRRKFPVRWTTWSSKASILWPDIVIPNSGEPIRYLSISKNEIEI